MLRWRFRLVCFTSCDQDPTCWRERLPNDNKRIEQPYVACHNAERTRWIITAWEPGHRPWANPPCPCLHSDPKFPDCEPGQTVRTRGWLSFYEGTEIEKEIARIAKLHWERD